MKDSGATIANASLNEYMGYILSTRADYNSEPLRFVAIGTYALP